MNKPISMIIKETKTKLAKVCNESGLSPVILDLIMYGIYTEIHSLAEKQAVEEESIYVNSKDITKDTNVSEEECFQ